MRKRERVFSAIKCPQLPWFTIIIISCAVVYICAIALQSNFTSTKTGLFVAELSKNDDPWEMCELPKYDLWDEELMKFVNPDQNPLKNCDHTFKQWTKLVNSRWEVTAQASNFTCRARCHTRQSDYKNVVGNWTYTPGKVDCEVLETVCSEKAGNKSDVYGYLHSQIIKKKELKAPKREHNTTKLIQHDVFVILFDSLSFSQAKRSLPSTLSYFTNHMKGVIFPYMNKVGDNSMPNGVALWFGKSIEKLDRSLFEKPNVNPDWTSRYFCDFFKDNETSLFDEFREYGYKTLLAEDWDKGLLNWPSCKGYDNPPIEHNMRPFQLAYYKFGTGITRKHLKGHLCREHHHTLLEYLHQFIEAYPDQNKFAFEWLIELGHNTENGFTHADKDILKFLIDHRKQLDNSFLFLLADHGFRLGRVRHTFVGGLDANNPFTAISIPKRLRNHTDILKILQENSAKLQSQFDTRATILDILKLQPRANFSLVDPISIPNEKGNSYIRRQPAIARNCHNLPIPVEYCICQFKKNVLPTNTTIASRISEMVISKVNEQLQTGNFTDRCIEMKFGNTISLLQYASGFQNSTIYKVITETVAPSRAQFQANVKVQNDKFKVLGTVERINKYGKTADCIKSEYHRPYCFCKIQPKTA